MGNNLSDLDFRLNEQLRARVARNLAAFERRSLDEPALRQAAVALVMVAHARSEWTSILLTRRAKSLRRHSGQYALPGGRVDEGESCEQAALRELDEELGIEIGGAKVLGLLDDFATRSGYCITPVVVWGGVQSKIEPNPQEVAAVFHIPLLELVSPDIPQLASISQSAHPVLSAPLPTLGHEVYAPTAAILYQFREVGLRGRFTRVAHFEQPTFAWR